MERLTFIVILVFWSNLTNATVLVKVDDSLANVQSSVKIVEGQTITLKTLSSGYWVEIRPLLQEYDNLKSGAKSIEPIEYAILPVEKYQSDTVFTIDNIKVGTYYYGRVLEDNKSFTSTKPIHLIDDNIIQIVVRESSSYIGFLTEQLNLPFIIPPKVLPKFGHQTDLNIGTDCAELAIYGMRRLGYNIPYVGPKGITKYLFQVDSITSGTILHFGFQVSILYEDRGEIGELDSEDLLVHAFEDRVKIEPLGATKLLGMECKKYQWDINNCPQQ
jgi:hypothetical protein